MGSDKEAMKEQYAFQFGMKYSAYLVGASLGFNVANAIIQIFSPSAIPFDWFTAFLFTMASFFFFSGVSLNITTRKESDGSISTIVPSRYTNVSKASFVISSLFFIFGFVRIFMVFVGLS